MPSENINKKEYLNTIQNVKIKDIDLNTMTLKAELLN